MSSIHVDGRTFQADLKRNLLDVCLSKGLNLEYFCWHPALGSVGACRQCAVKQFKDESDTQGRIVMACMTPAADGTRISVEDEEAVRFRAAIIEGLMLNHPHDCPVCDEGGECHLQDMTVMSGHNYRSYDFQKRTFRNQDLGPLINHEMNRCIQCYRCVRYYREYAGGTDLDAFLLHDTVFFGRHEDGVLENEFAGNLVEICPTGVFTDKTLKRHYTRKWDLQMAPSICAHCGLGCNTTAGERYGSVRRIVNRYNSEVNGYFLCDRGRFGYEFVNSERRIRQPLLRRNGNQEPVSKSEILDHLKTLVAGETRIIGIGSPRASLEANFALRRLVGPSRFFAGMAEEEHGLISTMLAIQKAGPAHVPSLKEIEHCDAVLVLGEDVTNTAPRMALSLRQSVRQQPLRTAEKLNIPLFLDHCVREAAPCEKGPLFLATPYPTPLDDAATETLRRTPDDLARFGFAVAHVLDDSAPAVVNLSDNVRALAERVAQALAGAERPLVVAGPSCGSEAILHAAANVARALCKTGRSAALSLVAPEANSFGLALMDPGRLGEAFRAVAQGQADAVVVLENDLCRRTPFDEAKSFLQKAKHIIVVDHLSNATTDEAELVLPAATFAEGHGTFVSNEGRAQRFLQVYVPGHDVQESWRWLREVLGLAGQGEGRSWENLDDLVADMANDIPALGRIPDAALSSKFRLAGAKIPRESHRYSGRTAVLANISVHEPKPPEDADSPLSFTMEGNPNQPPPSLTPYFWAPGWNSIQATNKFQSEIAGPLRGGDPGVRLIEPGSGATGNGHFERIPAAFEPKTGHWLLLPRYHIFGSEELSSIAPGVAELAPGPYVLLNADDAAQLGVTEGAEVDVYVRECNYRGRAMIQPGAPRGAAALPAGFSDLQGVRLPAWGKVKPAP